MKKLLLISALLLIASNGWADEDFEKKTNFILYFKYLSDISEDLHRCAEMYTAINGYLFQNPESIFKTASSEEWLKSAGDATIWAVGIEAIIGKPNKVDSFQERFNRISFYQEILGKGEKGDQHSKDLIKFDLKVCVDIVNNNMELLSEIH